MIIRKETLPAEKAAFVLSNAFDYGCRMLSIKTHGKSADVSVMGDEESIKELFNELEEL